MNKVISFILGVVCTLAIVLTFAILKPEAETVDTTTQVSSQTEVVETTPKSDVAKKIAFVNNDTGIEGSEVNVASSLIDNMVIDDQYELETTTYNNAVNGLEDDNYAAYVVFGSNYSSSLFEITTDQLPSKAEIDVKVNGNLSDDQQLEVSKVLLSEYNYIDKTVAYVYTSYLLDAVHNSQNEIATVIENEQYMDSIAGSVASYSTETINKFNDYLENPQETEIELNTTTLESLYEQNVEELAEVNDIDVDSLEANVEADQASFINAVTNSMLSDQMEVSELDLELEAFDLEDVDGYKEQLNDLLVNSTKEINNITTNISNVNSQITNGLDYINSLGITVPNVSDIRILYVVETILNSSLDGEYNFDNITDLQTDPNYSTVFNPINDFILSYANWYNSKLGIVPTTCVDSECFEDFNTSYGPYLSDWDNRYNTIKNTYQTAVDTTETILTVNIPKIQETLNDYSEQFIKTTGLNPDSDFVSEIITDGNSLEQNYDRLTRYCTLHRNPSSVEAQNACAIKSITKDYLDYIAANAEYNDSLIATQETIDNYNQTTSELVNEQNSAVQTANDSIEAEIDTHNSGVLTTVGSLGSKANDAIDGMESAVNEKITSFNAFKNTNIDNLKETINGYEEELNQTIVKVEDTLLGDRQEASDAAKEYNDQYEKANGYYKDNVKSLTGFTTILSNTRNGEEGNLYLYDFFVNPIKVVVTAGDKTKDIISSMSESNSSSDDKETTESSKKNTMIWGLLAIIVVTGGLLAWSFLTGDDDDDDDEE